MKYLKVKYLPIYNHDGSKNNIYNDSYLMSKIIELIKLLNSTYDGIYIPEYQSIYSEYP